MSHLKKLEQEAEQAAVLAAGSVTEESPKLKLRPDQPVKPEYDFPLRSQSAINLIIGSDAPADGSHAKRECSKFKCQ